MINIFIIGSKGIPARYGGFESFVENLTGNKKSGEIRYHVSCMSETNSEFVHNNARCFNVKVGKFGSARAVVYDLLSLGRSLDYIEMNNLKGSIIYILACRIGPFMKFYERRIKKLGVKIYVNPDGHEWLRSKWNFLIRQYWKHSERLMVKHADLMICDSLQIQKYINLHYSKYTVPTAFIPYGSDASERDMIKYKNKYDAWCKEHITKPKGYFLIVGRFVPENNYELMIKEFMKSNSKRDLVIVSNVEKNDFYKKLLKTTNFDKDQRIKFVGTVYDSGLLKNIRDGAFAYIHGHEVGGTNPSLLEALASTDLNILLDVPFNTEVGQNAAIYFSKQENSLKAIIEAAERLSPDSISDYAVRSRKRILESYTWDKVISDYENRFITVS